METDVQLPEPARAPKREGWRENAPVAVFAALAAIGGFVLVSRLPRTPAVVTKPAPASPPDFAMGGGRPLSTSPFPSGAPDGVSGMPPPGMSPGMPPGMNPSMTSPGMGPGGVPGGQPSTNPSYSPDFPPPVATRPIGKPPVSSVPPPRPAPDRQPNVSRPPFPGAGRPMPPIGNVSPLPPLSGRIEPLDPSAIPPTGTLPSPVSPGPAPIGAASLSATVRNEALVAGGRILSSSRTADGGRSIRISIANGKAATLARRLRDVLSGAGSVSEPGRADNVEDAIADLTEDARKLRREREEQLKTFLEDAQPIKEIDEKLKNVENEIKARRAALRDTAVTIDVIVRAS